jgi:hypothetical protein
LFLTSSHVFNNVNQGWLAVNFGDGVGVIDGFSDDSRVRCVRVSSAKTCAPTPGGGTCVDAGYLYCSGSTCCPSSYPFFCPTTSKCYSTWTAAAAACGSTACSHCVGT